MKETSDSAPAVRTVYTASSGPDKRVTDSQSVRVTEIIARHFFDRFQRQFHTV